MIDEIISAPAKSATEAGCPPSTILLVEDDLLSQRLASVIFTKAGHEVVVADSVANGWEQLKTNPLIDLVVIDNHLGLENGWTLVGEIRKRPYLQDMPVIAYTGSRDRAVVMRYAELRVQAFHLKPFRAEVLLAELERAHATGWRERMWESPAKACRRLKIAPDQYAGLLNAGAGLLEQSCQTIRRLMLNGNDPRVAMTFRGMEQQLTQLGVKIVAGLCEQAELQLRRDDYSACSETLGLIDSVAAQLRRRALSRLDMGDAVVNGLTGATRVPFGSATPRPAHLPVAAGLPVYARSVLDRPLGAFGAHVGGLDKPFPDGKPTPLAADWFLHPAAALWYDSIDWLERVESVNSGVMVAELEKIHGYDQIAEAIMVRTSVLAPSRDGRVGWSAVVNKVGLPKAAVLVVAGRVCEAMVASPWPITPLRQHALTMLLLGFELGRLLRLTHPHKIAAAALARNLGVWTTVISDPLLAALTFARARTDDDFMRAQRDVLGLPFGEAAAFWLNRAELPQLYVDAASGRSTFDGSEVTNVVVNLVEQIAHAVLLGEPAAMDALGRLLMATDHPIWAALRRQGTELPSEPDELVGMIMPLARSAAWIAGEVVKLRRCD